MLEMKSFLLPELVCKINKNLFLIICPFVEGSGLGRGVAKRFASLGATVVLWDVNEPGNEETKRQILDDSSSAKVHSMKVDLCDRNDIYRVAQQVRISIIFSLFSLFICLSGSRSSRRCNNGD